MSEGKLLSIVIPVYNEGNAIYNNIKTVIGVLCENEIEHEVILVDDGSKDRTWEMIRDLHKADPVFRGVCLSRTKGHQNALMAGLMTVKSECDAAISMDADLQDDINAIDEMVDRYLEGYEVVYGVRSSRKKDTFFKRTTAQGFYKVMRAMGVETVYNHADYRLMSRRALEALSEFDEVNLFLRGIVPLVGFKSTEVTYERGERFAGESKYPLKKMLAFATEGITSMSVKPIRMIASLGILVFLFSIGVLIYSIIRKLTGYTVPGWAFLAVSIWALGGVQLLAIGVIGEYIGKIYLETKHRPKFIVAEYLNDD